MNSSPPPTVGRQITNRLPTVGKNTREKKYSTETYVKTNKTYQKRRTKSSSPTVGQMSGDCWPTVGGGELFFTITLPFVVLSATLIKFYDAMALLYVITLTIRYACKILQCYGTTIHCIYVDYLLRYNKILRCATTPKILCNVTYTIG